MRKFIKGCAITALVLFILGVILFTIAAVSGGTKTIWNMGINGRLNWNVGDFLGWKNEKNVIYSIEESTMFNNNYPIYTSGDASLDAKQEEVDSIRLEIGAAEVIISESKDEEYHIKATQVGKFQTYVKNGELIVQAVKSHGINVCEIYIYIPKGVTLKTLEVSFGAGTMEIGNLSADAIKMEVGAGKIITNNVQAEELVLAVGAGEAILKNCKAGYLETSVGVGSMTFNGWVDGDINAEVAMGSLDLAIEGSTEEEHNYNVECAAGSVEIGDAVYAGLVQERYINNHADSDYNLECAMGSLKVRFK